TRVDGDTRVEISSSRMRAPPLPPERPTAERPAYRSDFLEDDDAPTRATGDPRLPEEQQDVAKRRSLLPERNRTRLETLPPATAPRSRIPDPVESTRIDVRQPPRKPSR